MEPRPKKSGAAGPSRVDEVVPPPVCRGEAPLQSTVTTVQSGVTMPVSGKPSGAGAGGAPVAPRPPLDLLNVNPFRQVGDTFVLDPNVDLMTLLAIMIPSHSMVAKGVDKVGSWVLGSFSELRERRDSLHARLEDKESRDEARRPTLPPLSEGPPTTEDNPWKAGLTFTVSEEGELLSGGAFDVRDVSCFECIPKDSFPVCWVRRRPDVRPRADKVRKERLIMSQPEAQDQIMDLAEKGEFVNTGAPAFSRSYMTFHQPETAEMPFASKVVDVALKAVAVGRPTPPPLEEVTNTSLLVPFPAGIWEGVSETFGPRQLE